MDGLLYLYAEQRDFYHQTQSFFHYEWEIENSVHAHKAEMKREVKLCQFAFLFSVVTDRSVSGFPSLVCLYMFSVGENMESLGKWKGIFQSGKITQNTRKFGEFQKNFILLFLVIFI